MCLYLVVVEVVDCYCVVEVGVGEGSSVGVVCVFLFYEEYVLVVYCVFGD